MMLTLCADLLSPAVVSADAMYSCRFIEDEAFGPLMHGQEGNFAPECFI